MNGRLQNSVSATPVPSLPGSHAATSPSICDSCAGSMISGRPETMTTTHFLASAQTVSIAALSASGICIVWAGRSTPPSPGSKPQRGPPTSPKPSAYGVSPTTTTPTSRRPIGAEASLL